MTYSHQQVQTEKAAAIFCSAGGLPPLDPAMVARQQADERWLVTDGQGMVAARCSLWWRKTPAYPNQRLGLVGHYAARNPEAASQLLARACDRLAGQGCTMATGPMDGSTWHSYRLIVERGSEPPFFLEPDTPATWPAHFAANGFAPWAYYVSTVSDGPAAQPQRWERVARRAAQNGVHIRSMRLDQFEIELRRVYRLTMASFQQNFLYTPLEEAEFLAQYRPIRSVLQPDLCLIAERPGQPIGFLFAVPDLRGRPIDTVIIKTLAVHPDHRAGGLGSLLVARCHEIAASLGYKRAIHALMHASNASLKISRRFGGRIIRRYALMAKTL